VEKDHAKTGVLKYPGAPYKLSQSPWQLKRAAPLLGEHNEEIYCGRLGYPREELARLRRGGII
jgi:CoA:oxalate CoA-transferase